MRRVKKNFEVHLMRNWIWARWEWSECAVCNQEFRNERYFVVFEPRYNVNLCMSCCPTIEMAEKAYEKYIEKRKSARPPLSR